jgi:hypothetical protein
LSLFSSRYLTSEIRRQPALLNSGEMRKCDVSLDQYLADRCIAGRAWPELESSSIFLFLLGFVTTWK